VLFCIVGRYDIVWFLQKHKNSSVAQIVRIKRRRLFALTYADYWRSSNSALARHHDHSNSEIRSASPVSCKLIFTDEISVLNSSSV